MEGTLAIRYLDHGYPTPIRILGRLNSFQLYRVHQMLRSVVVRLGFLFRQNIGKHLKAQLSCRSVIVDFSIRL